jgi:hypothetical protein
MWSPLHADAKNVAALSSALLVCMVVPWLLCLLFFTGGLPAYWPAGRLACQCGGCASL